MRRLNYLLAALVLSTASLAGCAAGGSDDSIVSTDDESTLPGSIDLWQSADGWHFHLVAGNKQILLASEAYSSRTAALNGVLSTINNGVDPAQYKVVAATHGLFVGDAWSTLDHGVIREVLVTDTLAPGHADRRLRVVGIAPLIAAAIRRVVGGGSLAELYHDAPPAQAGGPA